MVGWLIVSDASQPNGAAVVIRQSEAIPADRVPMGKCAEDTLHVLDQPCPVLYGTKISKLAQPLCLSGLIHDRCWTLKYLNGCPTDQGLGMEGEALTGTRPFREHPELIA